MNADRLRIAALQAVSPRPSVLGALRVMLPDDRPPLLPDERRVIESATGEPTPAQTPLTARMARAMLERWARRHPATATPAERIAA